MFKETTKYIVQKSFYIIWSHIILFLYLHFIAIIWISPKLFIIINENGISDRFIVIGSILTVSVVVSILLSYILRYLVEKPALKASHSVLKKLKL